MCYIPLTEENFKKAQDAYKSGRREECLEIAQRSLMPMGNGFRDFGDLQNIASDDEQFIWFYEFVRWYVVGMTAKATRSWNPLTAREYLENAKEIFHLTLDHPAIRERIENDPILFEFIRDGAKIFFALANMCFLWERRNYIRDGISLLLTFSNFLPEDHPTKDLMLIEASLASAVLTRQISVGTKRHLAELYEKLAEENPHRVITVIIWCRLCIYDKSLREYAESLLQKMNEKYPDMVETIYRDQAKKLVASGTREAILIGAHYIPVIVLGWMIAKILSKR